jgi:hypothetical protein
MTPEQGEAISEAFQRNPRNSIWRAIRELRIPHLAVQDVARKRLKSKVYKVQWFQKLLEDDLPWLCYFAAAFPPRIYRVILNYFRGFRVL